MQHDAHSAEILAHIERHLEPVRQVLQRASDDPRGIDIALVPATETRPIHTLVTLGMSRVAMPVPDDETPDRIELMMVLPRRWGIDADALQSDEWGWPVRQLRRLASGVIDSSARLAWGDVVPNGDPPQPLAPGSRLCGVVIVPSLHVPPPFYQLASALGPVTFYSAVPLYAEEMQLARERGSKVLFEKLIDHEVRDLVDPKRRNVAKKRFGLF